MAREDSTEPGRKVYRLSALDFTKGALVLFMVLYHWFNYFYGPQSDLYKYLRFLTPSFIFITGFLVSHIYLPKHKGGDLTVPKRLTVRGLKLLALFLGLNAFISLLVPHSYNGRIGLASLDLDNVIRVYITGNTLTVGHGKAAAFFVLLSISYVLLLSACLVMLSRRYKYVFHVTCGALVLWNVALAANGIESANLELIAIGLLGVLVGYCPIERINALAGHWVLLLLAYISYTVTITVFPVGYTLQVISVLLNVMMLYVVGMSGGDVAGLRNRIVLLGKYSLFGYIAQIGILQVVYRAARHVGTGIGISGVALAGTVVVTVASVVILDRARTRSPRIDRLYRVVFS